MENALIRPVLPRDRRSGLKKGLSFLVVWTVLLAVGILTVPICALEFLIREIQRTADRLLSVLEA